MINARARGLFSTMDFPDADIAKLDVRLRIVRLRLNRPRLQPHSIAWIVVRLPIIGPIGHLHPVDPSGNVGAAP